MCNWQLVFDGDWGRLNGIKSAKGGGYCGAGILGLKYNIVGDTALVFLSASGIYD